MIDEAKIDELLRLAEKAHFVGRWEYFPRRNNAVRAYFVTVPNEQGDSMYTWQGFVRASFEADALYLIAAANLAPALASELRGLKADNAVLNGKCGKIAAHLREHTPRTPVTAWEQGYRDAIIKIADLLLFQQVEPGENEER